MKNLITSLLLTLTCASTTTLTFASGMSNEDKISKMTRDVMIEPVKENGTVALDMYLKNPQNIQEMIIERGTALGESFRQVKIVSSGDLASVANGKITIDDNYPLPGNENVYYRAVVVDKEGVVRYFPANQIVTASK